MKQRVKRPGSGWWVCLGVTGIRRELPRSSVAGHRRWLVLRRYGARQGQGTAYENVRALS